MHTIKSKLRKAVWVVGSEDYLLTYSALCFRQQCQPAAKHMHSDIIHIYVDEVKKERYFFNHTKLGGTIGLLKLSAVRRFVKADSFVKTLFLLSLFFGRIPI